MTTTLSAKGQIVIPHEIRSRLNLGSGDGFLVLCSESGDILLKPLRKGHRENLADALLNFGEFNFQRHDEEIRNLDL